MKKIILFLLISALIVISFTEVGAACGFNGNISSSIDNCLDNTDLVDAGGDMRIETGIKYQVIRWTTAIAQLLGLLAVGAIVYGGFMMTISGGEDEKIKKGKDIVKWSLIGFLGVVMTGGIIRVLVEFIFDVAS